MKSKVLATNLEFTALPSVSENVSRSDQADQVVAVELDLLETPVEGSSGLSHPHHVSPLSRRGFAKVSVFVRK